MNSLRVGVGTDLHHFVAGRPLFLGGVEIPGEDGLLGHSDGDALLHALCDACLGAAGEEDIGMMFSDQDPEIRGISSRLIAAKVVDLLANLGWGICNLDAVIEGKRPRVSTYREAMRQGVAKSFSIPKDRVNVRGKTNEGVGIVGQGKALSVIAVALLHRAASADNLEVKAGGDL